MNSKLLTVEAEGVPFIMSKDTISRMPGGRLKELLLKYGNWHKPPYKRIVYVDCSGDVFSVILKYLETGFAVATEQASADELETELAHYFSCPPDVLVKYNKYMPMYQKCIDTMIFMVIIFGCGIVLHNFAKRNMV